LDIPRDRSAKPQRYIKLAVVAGGVILLTILLSSLRPAAPRVELAAVLTDSVRRGELVREVSGPGSLVPEQVRWISALTPARVERILARPGDSVQTGTVLMELSNPDVQIQALEAQQQLTAAQAQLINLRATLETQQLAQQTAVAQARTAYNEAHRNAALAETLAVRGFGSSFELSRARDQAEEATTRLQIEERRLRLLTESMQPQLQVQEEQVDRLRAVGAHRQNEVRGLRVRAGEHGVLQELPLQLGQWVVPGMVLARVVQPSRLKAVLRIPEVQVTDVRIGQRAVIDVHTGTVSGRVIRIDPSSQNSTVGVDVALEGNLPRSARPELSVDGTIEIERLPNVLYVGRPAFGQANTTIRLFKFTDGANTAVRVSVRIGKTSVSAVEILDGLQIGDRVILSDMSRWENLDRVRLH
jgi:HlyD family secretion protein